jgi:predicted site-specific integrase-resolvase
LQTILDQAMQRNVSEVLVAHKDRLCRFGFDLLEWILSKNKVRLVVLDQENNAEESSQLAQDVLAIIHVYSCKQMGKRRYTNAKNKTQAKPTPAQAAT